ncbi:MAG: hypothetical protein LBH29_02255 [Elusimicrobiota bacterium]|jgi:biotin carboxyl carrier protein|nr:hypothetical protein [Elusimicrobiota bacterium]
METQELKRFLRSIRETDNEELKYQSGDETVYFKKSEIGSIPLQKTETVKAVKTETAPSAEESAKKPQEPQFIEIKSIMVGTFSDVLDADNNPLAREGSKISKGQKLGQIEAMKIIKDIISESDGIISKAFVLNGESVEYGQKLFLIEISKQS